MVDHVVIRGGRIAGSSAALARCTTGIEATLWRHLTPIAVASGVIMRHICAMELDGYIDRLRTEFAAISEVAGKDVREVAERLVAPLESAVRLVLLEVLAAAADEITLDLVPGSVHLRLRESTPDFVVTTAAVGRATPATSQAASTPAASGTPPTADGEGGQVARINFRPPESLKARIEEAAGRGGLSVNTWLTRMATAALQQPLHHPPSSERDRGGWFG